MTSSSIKPVLIIGGSGIVGSLAATMLRKQQPDLAIAIGGRDLAKAEAVSTRLGNATAVRLDLDEPDLGLDETASFSAVVVFVKDSGLNAMKYALLQGIPYLSISTFVFEVGPEMALFVRYPASAPVFMGSQWLVGAAALPALHFAKEFQRVDAFEISAVLDELDMGGPAAFADFERLTALAPRPLVLENGRWVWVSEELAARTVTAVDGVPQEGQAYSPLDVLSLSTATAAQSIRFDLVYGESAGTRAGGPFTTEIVIQIRGTGHDGAPLERRHELVHPEGQAPVTAAGVVLAIEHLLALDGRAPVAPGLYFPENLIEPEAYLARLEEVGLQVKTIA